MRIPDVIYLQILDEYGEPLTEVTWCQDRIYKTDIEYLRKEGVGLPPSLSEGVVEQPKHNDHTKAYS